MNFKFSFNVFFHLLCNKFITNNIENRSIFADDVDKSLWLSFWCHPVDKYLFIDSGGPLITMTLSRTS